MCSAKSDSMIKEALKNLCCGDGWSYGLFWGFDERNPLFLTLKDAYLGEEMGALMDNILMQLHVLGEGVIGQAALTKSNKWLFSDSHHGSHISLGSLQDDSEFYCQFSMGIKTIALIAVEQWGVVQLGSTRKIPQRKEFIEQVKELFRGIGINQDIELSENEPSSSSDQFLDSSAQLMSLLSNGIIHGPVNQNFRSAEYGNVMAPDHQNTDSLFTPPVLIEDDHIPISNLLSDCSSLTSSLPPHLGSSWNEYLPSSEFPKDMLITQNSGELTLDDLLEGNSFSPLLSNGLIPVSNLSGYNSPIDIPENIPTNSMQSSVSYALKSNPGNKCSATCAIDNQIDSFGCKKVQGWNQMLIPVTNADLLNFSTGSSECISGGCEKSKVGTPNTLFSQLGLDQILNGMASSSSCSKARYEDQSSSAVKTRKVDSSSYILNQGPLNIEEEMKTPNPACNSDNSEAFFKQRDSSSMGTPSPKPEKRKKARPGTKPRPKDRQMIQDRLAELRELIPNGEKMSIDRLLERTIRHLNFMQGVKKHAESLNNIDKQKCDVKKKDFSSNGVTWACEVGDHSMTCPLIVEDLSTPDQMLIEILCEEHDSFLEIADIIRVSGLIILKGVMEVREAKIWARYIVEDEGKGHVTRHKIFSSLIHRVQITSQSSTDTNDCFGNDLSSDAPSLFSNCQPGVVFPVNLADTLQPGSLL